MTAFPRELAKVIDDKWSHLVGGDYVTPPKPPLQFLRQFLEVIYLAAAKPEEGRYPRFNVMAIPANEASKTPIGTMWRFRDPRALSVDEIHRLAPAVDFKNPRFWRNGKPTDGRSADWLTWERLGAVLVSAFNIIIRRQPACLSKLIDPDGYGSIKDNTS